LLFVDFLCKNTTVRGGRERRGWFCSGKERCGIGNLQEGVVPPFVLRTIEAATEIEKAGTDISGARFVQRDGFNDDRHAQVILSTGMLWSRISLTNRGANSGSSCEPETCRISSSAYSRGRLLR